MKRLLFVSLFCVAACVANFDVGDTASTSEGQGESGETQDSGSDDNGVSCGEGLLECATVCVDPDVDSQHCGSCGNNCDEDEDCVAGACMGECQADCDPQLEVCSETQCLCRPGLTRCGGDCVDLESDPAHCGMCDDACGEFCDEASCESQCSEGEDEACGNACVDFDEDPLHCGNCETACDADELCVKSECKDYEASSCEHDDECGGGRSCCDSDFLESMVCVEGDECP